MDSEESFVIVYVSIVCSLSCHLFFNYVAKQHSGDTLSKIVIRNADFC
jgi:hypothetical protein